MIILLLVLALAAFLIAYADFFDLFLLALLLLFIASQIFWIGRILDLGERFIPGKPRRARFFRTDRRDDASVLSWKRDVLLRHGKSRQKKSCEERSENGQVRILPPPWDGFLPLRLLRT